MASALSCAGCRIFSNRTPNRRRDVVVCRVIYQRQYAASATRQQAAQCHPVIRHLAAAAAAAVLLLSPPATAELQQGLQTVVPSDITAAARPLPKQQVKKGRVWLIFVVAAAGLFGSAVLLENNARLFPAIHKANLALAETRKRQKEEQVAKTTMLKRAEMEQKLDRRLEDSVAAGLAEARRNAGMKAGPSQAVQHSSKTPAAEGKMSGVQRHDSTAVPSSDGLPATQSVMGDGHRQVESGSGQDSASDGERTTEPEQQPVGSGLRQQ